MNDIVPEISADGKLAELERRILTLETKVSAIPDSRQIEEHVTERVKASMPPPPPPIEPTQAPSYRDIEIPIPSAQTLVNTAKATWMLFEMVRELKMFFWTLFDRRYHMAWITRFITITLLILIMTSQWWAPFAGSDSILGATFARIWDKVGNLILCLILFMVLSFETRRYKEWRNGRNA